MATAGELRRILEQSGASWSVSKYLEDDDPLPRYALGGDEVDRPPPVQEIEALDFQRLFERDPGQPHLFARRQARGLVHPDMEAMHGEFSLPIEIREAQESTTPATVDWRNRWFIPWITTIRNQNGCQACWAFTATALVEAMVRIEHAVWTTRSEGDLHKGMGAVCATTGGTQNALNWIVNNGGIADPACFPWSVPDTPWGPSLDRPGRTVRIPAPTLISSVEDQKAWLDTVGPIATTFDVWTDFFALGTGVYSRQAFTASGQPNVLEGGHDMLVVGFDDNAGCWIVKNSWPSTWGENGFGRIAYGECRIDDFAKIGLKGTDPDPWTKRRLHSGGMIESGRGTLHRNFELVFARNNHGARHWSRDGSALTWSRDTEFGNDAASCPTLTATTFDRNFECVHLTTASRLRHWKYELTVGSWQDVGEFGPADADGVPGFLQSNSGSPGNYEVVVKTASGRLNHLWRMAAHPWTWFDGGRFGSNVAQSGATLVQSGFGQAETLEVVCVLANGKLQHWRRGQTTEDTWQLVDVFAEDWHITSPPCMIEGQFGADDETQSGNFELCVAHGGKVLHWWRDNSGGTGWQYGTSFGQNVDRVLALVEGSFGFNLELVVQRTDGKIQHYWRDLAGWHPGIVIDHV